MKLYIITAIAGIAFAFHCVCVTLSLLPPNPATPAYAHVVKSYINPLFRQNWRLFAPEPAVASLHFKYRCWAEDQHSDWKDPIQEKLSQHKRTYFTFLGKQVYIYKHLARQLHNLALDTEKTVSKKSSLIEKISSSTELREAQRFVKSKCLSENLANSSGEFEISRVFTENFSTRENPLGAKKKMFKFPRFSWSI